MTTAFRQLTEPQHCRELQVHCYRMLGSFQDAEDALQDTLLAAWKGFGGFEGASRFVPGSTRSPPTAVSTPVARPADSRPRSGTCKRWNRPSPPDWAKCLARAVSRRPSEVWRRRPPGPEARYEQTEAISLAFVTALQVLPPRQFAVFVFRDVLGFQASEVADMLDATLDSVNSALKRGGPTWKRRGPAPTLDPLPPQTRGRGRDRGKVCGAWESADLEALVALLTDDVFISMPPIPFEYEGRDLVASFCASIFGSVEDSSSFRPEPMDCRRLELTCAAPMTSATEWASSSSPSLATGSAP